MQLLPVLGSATIVSEISDQVAVSEVTCPNKSLQPGQALRLSQAYQKWLGGSLPYLFISNNDVLIPDGSLSAMAKALTPEGEYVFLICAIAASVFACTAAPALTSVPSVRLNAIATGQSTLQCVVCYACYVSGLARYNPQK